MLKIPKHKPAPKTEKTSAFAEIREGFRFTWNNRFLRKLFATYCLYIFLCVPSGFLAALMIKRTFGDNIMFLTVNEAVGFAGSVLAGLLLGATGGFKNRVKTLFLGILFYDVASLAIGFTNVFWLFAVLMFFIGLTIPVAQTSVFTLVQEKVEPPMVGFAMGKDAYTGERVRETGKVIVALPGISLGDAVMSCGSSSGSSSGSDTDKTTEFSIALVEVPGSSIKIPADTKLVFVATLNQTVEVGDHYFFICDVDKMYGDETKDALFAWNGYSKVASAQEK